MGVLLVTPVMLTFPDLLRIRSSFRMAELVAGLFLLALLCFIIFGDLPLIPIRLHILAFAVLPFVIGAAIRFGVSGAGLATLVIASIATVETELGSGPFASNSQFMNAVLLDVFFAALSVSGLTLAAVITEKEQSERERERLVREQAVMERKVVEQERLLSENRFRQFFETVPEFCYIISPNGEIVDANLAACAALGYTKDEIVGKPLSALYAPECVPTMRNLVEKWRAVGEVRNEEMVVITKQGERRTVLLNAGCVRDSDGNIVHSTSVQVDITERKRAEEALSGMSRKLIEAQDQERTRIGRDLHDDIVQRLVLLSIGLEGVQQDVPDSVAELGKRIGDLQNQTTQITNDVQVMSHELHSSKLEYLGIVEAMNNFCKEFGERQRLELDFQSHDLPASVPTELSLSLFRVLQEALRNATKHSGVKSFEVRLWGGAGELHLTVSDLGAGFDTDAAMKSTGLGLTSMQERLRLVGGELSINSQPKRGTTIHARVPITSSSDSARAAGQE